MSGIAWKISPEELREWFIATGRNEDLVLEGFSRLFGERPEFTELAVDGFLVAIDKGDIGGWLAGQPRLIRDLKFLARISAPQVGNFLHPLVLSPTRKQLLLPDLALEGYDNKEVLASLRSFFMFHGFGAVAISPGFIATDPFSKAALHPTPFC
jgi:hypothetical protein